MAVTKIQDILETREKMNEKSKSLKAFDKRTLVIAQEIKLAKVLAGNNKTLRDRALKRLKLWFEIRSKTTPFTEDDFMRIWKGLFFAMWMSDKPLVQEKCAEAISSLLHFSTSVYSLLFFKCGLRTLGNEWFGIDQLRLDKFLMFVRRLLRQGFVILQKNNWNLKIIKEFNNVLSATILNTENPPPAGLVLHFTEIYLEELAKVSEGNLKPNLLTEFVSPFIKQLSVLDDSRQIKCIMKNIFHYLMRQSELGMEYDEKFKAWRQQGFPGGCIDTMQKEELSDDEKMSDDNDDEDNIEENSNRNHTDEKVLDPRAGHVDVVLHQLKFVPKQVIEILNQNRFVSNSNSKSRKAISIAIDEFTQFSKGQYPIGLRRIDTVKNDGYSTRTRHAANRLVKFEKKLLNKHNKKRKRKNSEKSEDVEVKKTKVDMNSDNVNLKDDLQDFLKPSASNIKVSAKKTKNKVNKNIVEKEGVPEIDEKRKVIKKIVDTKLNKVILKDALKEFIKKSENNIKINNKKNKKIVRDGTTRNEKKKIIDNDTKSDSVTLEDDLKEFIKKSESNIKINNNKSKNKDKKILQDDVRTKINEKRKIIKREIAKKKKSIKTKQIAFDESINKNYECTFERNSGTWYVYDDDSSTTSSSFDISTSDISQVVTESTKSNESTTDKCTKLNGNVQIEDKSPKKRITPTKVIETDICKITSTPSRSSPNILFKQDDWEVPLKDGETEIFIESAKFKTNQANFNITMGSSSKSITPKLKRRSLDLQIVKNPFATPGSLNNKKVKIALNLNKSQDIKEHVAQIKSSPGIPFDANRKPSKPLLKRNTISPIDPFYRRKL